MDFSTDFITLRDRMAAGQDGQFVSRVNTEVCGKMAALYSALGLDAERKILGLVPTGGKSHAHEYRLLFAAPALDEAQLDGWWDYIRQVENELVRPDADHVFSMVSLILVAEQTDKKLQKKLRRLAAERKFDKPAAGWSSVRIAVVDLAAHKIYTNRLGETLKNVLAPWL